MQRWWPQEFLPAFDSFQGSTLPYSILLSAQIVILGWMVRATVRVARGRYRPGARAHVVLGAAGVIYWAGAFTRIAVGLTWSEAPSWFTAWVPAFFHVVLASFVVTLAHYHCRQYRLHEAAT
jgi:hypothetical protein